MSSKIVTHGLRRVEMIKNRAFPRQEEMKTVGTHGGGDRRAARAKCNSAKERDAEIKPRNSPGNPCSKSESESL